MKRSLLVWSTLLAGATVAAAQVTTQTPAPTKVGIIHIQNAILGTQDGKKAVTDLEAKSAPKKKDIERLQAEIAGMRDQLNKTSSVGSEEQKNKLVRDIDAKTKSFNRQVEDAQAELDQDQSRILNEIGSRMVQVLDKYSRDNGYALVLDVSNQNTPVMFASNTIDVTQEIVGLYDKNAPAMAAPAAAKPGVMTMPRTTPPPAKPTSPAPKPPPVK